MTAATQCASEALAQASEPAQPLSQLAALRALGELATKDRKWDEAEVHLADAQLLAEACAAPFERARTLLSLSELRTEQGATDQATALIEEIQAICEPLSAQPLLERAAAQREQLNRPAQRASARNPAGLSSREVEVLRLVAKGMTNAEIGDELSISPRTVQQHLTNLYAKLDVLSRAGATRFAVENGLQ